MTKKENIPAFVKRDAIVNGDKYRSFISSLKEKYRKSQIKAAVKVNRAMLEFYWDMGRDISILKKDAKWGSAFFDCISLDMKAEFPGEPGFSSRNIRYMYDWYVFYNQQNTILPRVVAKLDEENNENLHQLGAEIPQQIAEELEMPHDFGLIPWKHHVLIFTSSNSIPEALFYVEETIKNGWSRRELEFAIDDNLYAKKGNVITNFDEKLPEPFSGLAQDILKSPYNFSFIEKPIVSEKQLEDELARNITRFLLELGQGFAYVGRQMELKMPGGQTFIPDMIFYNTHLHSYIVCELKNSAFQPEFAGKLNFYVSAVDELMKGDDDNPTIGLLICKSKDNTVVEWSFRGMSQPLGVAEFELKKKISEKIRKYLPTEEELKNIIDTY